MRYQVFTDVVQPAYPYCLLIDTIQPDQIKKAYLAPATRINEDELLVLTVHHGPNKKTPKAEIVQYINEELVPALGNLAIDTLLVADAEYFKALTKTTKVEPHIGYVLDCVFGPWKVVYLPHHRQIFYDPDKIKAKVALALDAAVDHRLGNYQAPGNDLIKFAAIPLRRRRSRIGSNASSVKIVHSPATSRPSVSSTTPPVLERSRSAGTAMKVSPSPSTLGRTRHEFASSSRASSPASPRS